MTRAKAAVITGSTSGIGLGIARALARSGVGVMLNGRIEQLGSPQEIYQRPRTAFISEFVGAEYGLGYLAQFASLMGRNESRSALARSRRSVDRK